MLKGVHFIDSSIFLSVILHDEHEKAAARYLTRIRNGIYDAYVSHLVIGEIAVAIRDEVNPDDFNDFYGAIEEAVKLLRGVKLHTPMLADYMEKLQILKELENRVSATDVRIIAEAATSRATKLITLDTKYNTCGVGSMIEVVNLEAGTL